MSAGEGSSATTMKQSKKAARGPAESKPACPRCVPAKCCMYFSTEIDKPETPSDFDDLLWIIAHRNVEIYTKGRSWHVLVKTPCRFYDPPRGCLIYPTRPRICREHDAGDCEFDQEYDFDLHFRSYEELERHTRGARNKKRAARVRNARRAK